MGRVRKERSSSKKILILLAVGISIFVLIFSAAASKYKFPMSEKIVTTVLAPFQSVANGAGNYVRQMTTAVWEVATVYKQNQMLLSEVGQLREMKVQVNEVMAENQRLRALLGYKQITTQFDLVSARIIARDPGNWTDTMMINRGTNDGIQKDMVVVTAQGLVGNVVSVFSTVARVQLILDPRSSVGALVQRAESRVAGIVEGNSSDKTLVRMVNIPRDSDIVEGDQIITSGFGGIYPKGIAVGSVESIANDGGGLLKYAMIKPAVDFQKLEEVAVIVQSREALPAALPPTDPANKAVLASPVGGKP